MATNLALNDHLVNQAKKLGKHRSKRDAVNTALQEYVSRRERTKVASLFGHVEWDSDYDYKTGRQRK